jgi:carbon monoxide dehydrogenase subunit G
MKVDIEIERSLDVAAPYAEAEKLIRDVEGTIRRFPKLRRLTRLGENQYQWDMATIGSRIAKIAHEVSYGAHYSVDPKKGELSWKPLPKIGNASVEGIFRVARHGDKTRLSFRVRGELRDVPVPLMYRLIAPAFIQGKFTALVDVFLAKTAEAIGGPSVAADAAGAI